MPLQLPQCLLSQGHTLATHFIESPDYEKLDEELDLSVNTHNER